MNYLVVDDETIIVEGMVDTLNAFLKPGDKVLTANNPFDALEELTKCSIDVVITDVDMPGMNGLKLAAKISEISPNTDIIFSTGYAHYSLDAWKTVAKAFILKPATEEELKKAFDKLDVMKKRDGHGFDAGKKKAIEAKCFGNFEIFYEGTPIHFARKKSKEMVAYLIDRKGAMISTGEIRAALWDEDADSDEKKGYIRVLANDIRNSLEDCGVENFLMNDMDCYAINKSLISCDYFDFLDGDKTARKSFAEEYMVQYSWAETTYSVLVDMLE